MNEKILQSNLYETDFYGWTPEQAKLLREGDCAHLRYCPLSSIVHLVAAIEALGRQERRELKNRVGALIEHLLQWEYQPEKRSKSWRVTIQMQRREINDKLMIYWEKIPILGCT